MVRVALSASVVLLATGCGGSPGSATSQRADGNLIPACRGGTGVTVSDPQGDVDAVRHFSDLPARGKARGSVPYIDLRQVTVKVRHRRLCVAIKTSGAVPERAQSYDLYLSKPGVKVTYENNRKATLHILSGGAEFAPIGGAAGDGVEHLTTVRKGQRLEVAAPINDSLGVYDLNFRRFQWQMVASVESPLRGETLSVTYEDCAPSRHRWITYSAGRLRDYGPMTRPASGGRRCR